MIEVRLIEPNVVVNGGRDGLIAQIDYLIGHPAENEIELNNGVEMNRADYLKLTCPKCKKKFQYQRSEVPTEDVICECGQEIIKYLKE